MTAKKLLDAYNAAFFHPTNPGDVIWEETQKIMRKIEAYNRKHPMCTLLLTKQELDRWEMLAN